MAAAAHPAIYLLMGVSGCGKSSVGHRLAAALNVPYVEADEFHPPENVARMAAGTPLTDADRQGWLLALRDRLAHSLAQGRGAVLGCSALKRSYRDILRTGAPQLRLVHLHGSRALLAARLAARRDHYMPASLLDSQLATLQVPEPDEDALRVDISQDVDTIVTIILATGTPAHD
jgi:gluconokinase